MGFIAPSPPPTSVYLLYVVKLVGDGTVPVEVTRRRDTPVAA